MFLKAASVELSEVKAKSFSFVVHTTKKDYFLNAFSQEERDKWIQAIQAAIKCIDREFAEKDGQSAQFN